MKVRGSEERRGLAAAAVCEERRALGSANPLLHHPRRVTQLARPELYRVGLPDPNAAVDELLSILLFEEQDEEKDNNDQIETAQVFLSGSSPPSRPANPMVMDPMFGEINPIERFLPALWQSGERRRRGITTIS